VRFRVTDIQRFCVHDGPGIRTTVFLAGCPLTCLWCHNPETANNAAAFYADEARCLGCGACVAACANGAHAMGGAGHVLMRERCARCMRCVEACPTGALLPTAQDMTADEILAVVLRDKAYYGETGGVTVSGGEPLLRFDEAIAFLRLCKARGIHTCVETSGVFRADGADALAEVCDCVLFDVKDTDSARLFANTGARLSTVLENLAALDARGVRTVMRAVLIGGVNANDAHADALAKIFCRLSHCECVELLPYHPYGGAKARQLGLSDTAKDEWNVPQSDIERFAARLAWGGARVKVEGSMRK